MKDRSVVPIVNVNSIRVFVILTKMRSAGELGIFSVRPTRAHKRSRDQ